MVLSTGLRFLALRIEWIRVVPQQPEAGLTDFTAAAYWALSLSVYGSILLGLGYAARKKVFSLFAVLCIAVLSLGFTLLISSGLKNWENMPGTAAPERDLGGAGLIITNYSVLDGTAAVLLQGPSEPEGPRVTAVPGQPLVYRAEFPGSDITALPSAPFGNDSPWFIQSLAIDIRLSAENLRRCFNSGPLSFLIYAGALVILLTSCVFIFKLTSWPLANLFLGCLAFRGILALETFFNSPEVQEILGSFLQYRLPVSFVVPFIFCFIGILAYLYTFFSSVSKRRDDYDD